MRMSMRLRWTFSISTSAALGAQENGGDAQRTDHFDALNPIEAEQVADVPHRIGGDGVGLLDFAAAAAGGAVGEVHALVAGSHALAGHLEDAELADGEDGRAGAVAS